MEHRRQPLFRQNRLFAKAVVLTVCFAMMLGLVPGGSLGPEKASAEWVDLELVNPSFEEPHGAEGNIPGWKQTYGKSGFTVTEDRSFIGEKSLYVEDLDSRNYGMQSVYLPAQAGKSYSVTTNTYVLEGTSMIYLQFHKGDANRTRIGHKSMGESVVNEWRPLTASLTAPAGTEYVSVLLYSGVSTTAKAFFDNVVLSLNEEEPSPTDKLVRLGTPIHSITIPHAAFGQGPTGENYIYTTANGAPAVLSVLRAETGERVASFELGQAGYSWGSTVAPNGDLYVATQRNGILYRYRPSANTVDNLGKAIASETHLYRVVSDDQGRIYGGTYPNGKVFRFDPSTNAYTDFGTMAEGEQYVRSIAYGDGKVYAGTGANQAQLFKLDPETGAKEAIPLPEAFRQHKEVYDLTFTAGLLFARMTYQDASSPLNNVTLVYDTAVGQWVGELPNTIGLDVSPVGPDGNVYLIQNTKLIAFNVTTREATPTSFEAGNFASRGFGWFQLNLPDMPGESLVTVTSRGRIMAYNPQTEKGIWIDGDPLGSANTLRSVSAGPDGNIYVGGYLSPQSMARFNIDTFQLETLPGMSQVEGMGTFGENMYYGVYPNAKIFEYDPNLPWSMPNNPSELDIEMSSKLQDRPFAFAEAGDKLAVGTVPIIGKLGGALTLYDPAAKTSETFYPIVDNESPMTLAYKDGLLYGGTTVWGGIAAEPVEQDGTLFIFGVATKQKVFEMNPVPGERAITALAFDGNGMLWGLTNGVLFQFDPATREIVRTKTLYPFVWNDIVLAGGYLSFYDGYLYGEAANHIFRFDPTTWEHKTLAVGNYFAQDEYGRIFTTKNSIDLYMYDDIAPSFGSEASLQYEWMQDESFVLKWPANADMKQFQIFQGDNEVTLIGSMQRDGANGAVSFRIPAGAAAPGRYTVRAVDYAGNVSAEHLSVDVIPAGSSLLAALSADTGQFHPEFDPSVSDYQLNVWPSVKKVAFIPVTEDENAALTINGVAHPSGTPWEINVKAGETTAVIEVAAPRSQDTTVYTITVNACKGPKEGCGVPPGHQK
ncbi:hypothetical protein FE782_11715 [Paenibacillus antri]|uniref:Cadherin-like beta-sandwich-like domain-containing protein n=1 Tax=Paenibacillus antri TaxID=2582848 RepID=A0A5R9GF98_9BACL|nr:cadherin-like beta sandwich domain-containing protein [Paenibacillus antri]TLS52038.1 hypothetical protein FE782_11715 [Paenibacillus antri]